MLAGQDLSIFDALIISVVGLVIVLAELAIIAVLVMLVSKCIRAFEKLGKKNSAEPTAAPAAPVAQQPLANASAGTLSLVNVDEPTAAVIMAIVSHQSGIPLNKLDFKSIKLIEE